MANKTEGNGPDPAPATPADPAAAREAELTAAMEFDPFATMNQGPPATATSASAQPPAAAPAAPEGGTATAPEPGTGQPPAAPSRESELERAIRERDELILRYQQAAAPAAPGAPGAQPPAQPDPMEQYNFTIPTDLAQLLLSEDGQERLKGLSMLGGGLARTVHTVVMDVIKKQFDGVPVQIRTAIAQYAQQEAIKKDFYGTYKALDKPEYYQWITSIGAQVLKETGEQGYTPRVRDEIATRAAKVWGMTPEQLKEVPGQPPSTPAVPPTPPAPTPPANFDPGSRPGGGPGAPSNDPNSADAIATTLFG